ncbi:hypothetical protein EVAR_24082_1 [Eumeta japonica]|uniref:PiggyBac transposable element-derived protein domain-containing protein n=1 Tax=Eumeta variegata TaxID=151549 RepID=A0A4C1ZT16_EUMVA|nr:hypothetical protein EVAR_24082_1 [Eumeta japonica]
MKRWTMRLFYHFLDLAVINSWVMFKKINNIKGNDQLHNLGTFRLELAETLCKLGVPANGAKRGRPRASSSNSFERRQIGSDVIGQFGWISSRDRVFAKIEKTIRKKEVVTSPAEYVSVLEENATVTDLSKIALYDWKKGYENIIKPTTSWNFPFMKTKHFFLTRTKTENILVQGEIHYKSEINTKGLITKNKKKIGMLRPEAIPANNILPNKEKVRDVTKLLEKHYGVEWRNLNFLHYYRDIENRLQVSDAEGFISEITDDDANCLWEHGFEENNSHV